MHTTSQLAARLNVSSETVRRWGDTHQRYMSADSQRADQRQYTDDDLILLWSVKRWREFGYTLDDIAQRIERGERTTEPPPEPPPEDQQARVPVMIPEAQHTAALAEIRRLNGEVERLLIERDEAVGKLDRERTTWTTERAHVVADYNSKIATLERAVGRLEGQLENRRPAEYWLKWIAAAVVLAVLVVVVVALVVVR